MSDAEVEPVTESVKEPVKENASRKSSVGSSTGSSFENVDRVESSESQEELKDEETVQEAQAEEEGEEKPVDEVEEDVEGEEEGNQEEEVDPLDAPMKPEQEQFYTERDRARAIKLLIMFSSAMFTLPLLTMFSMYHYVFIDHFHLPQDQAMLYAGGCGVAVVIAIVSAFVYLAYQEEVEAEKRVKKQS